MPKPEPIIIIDEYGTVTTVEVEDTRDLMSVKQAKISAAAAVRDLFIVDGFRPQPMNIKLKLDTDTEARLTGAKSYLTDNPTQIIYWSLGGGNIIELNKPMILTIANQAGAHVQRGFRIYGQLCQKINALTTIDDIDAFDETAEWLILQNASN